MAHALPPPTLAGGDPLPVGGEEDFSAATKPIGVLRATHCMLAAKLGGIALSLTQEEDVVVFSASQADASVEWCEESIHDGEEL